MMQQTSLLLLLHAGQHVHVHVRGKFLGLRHQMLLESLAIAQEREKKIRTYD
jgi:hypothetical protein